MSNASYFADTTARFELPVLFPGQAQKEFTLNEAVARIDALLHAAVSGEWTSEPTDRVAGDCVLVGVGAVGTFAGHDGSLAFYDGQQWSFVVPAVGMRVTDTSSEELLYFNGTWQRAATPALPSDGANGDAEARQAIGDIVAALQKLGIFS